ncbi:MAG: sugar ABC transporter permease [Pleurocapsa minor GSE-CHR-MK-17-07R]|jgi:multiple sugar transport system permease protein|nr:sugar ABC transporter permease [Pleurocapsa minor GSE-CHR-MK 17-07R]
MAEMQGDLRLNSKTLAVEAPKARRRAARKPLLVVIQPYLYLLPAILAIGIWIYRPLLQTIELSFFEWNMLPTAPRTFVGLRNYAQLFSLPDMGRAFANTIVYMLGILPLSVLIPMIIAIVTNDIGRRARTIYRAMIFLPMIIAPVVVAVVWRWIFHPTNGILNTMLELTNLIQNPLRFFSDANLAIWVIIFITGWKLIGFSTLIFSAALSNINRDYIEAAQIDGASRIQIIRFILVPLLSPTILFMIMLTLLFASQWTFAYINVLTQGGPLNATTNIYFLLWNYGFRTFSVGWSSAAATVFFIGFSVIALLFIKLSNRLAFYDN